MSTIVPFNIKKSPEIELLNVVYKLAKVDNLKAVNMNGDIITLHTKGNYDNIWWLIAYITNWYVDQNIQGDLTMFYQNDNNFQKEYIFRKVPANESDMILDELKD